MGCAYNWKQTVFAAPLCRVGVISRYWNVSLLWLILLHALFEALENTERGMWMINTYASFWPGGKTHADSIMNRVGDTVYSGLGWVVANYMYTNISS